MRCIFTNRTIAMTSLPIGTNPTIGTNGPSVWRIVSVCVHWTCVGALSGGGGEVFDPNEFCFCSITRNETENNLIGSIRKHTRHLHGFLSRAMVKYWKVKMRGGGGGAWGQSSRFFYFFQFYQVYFLWAPLHSVKSHESSLSSSFMFETYLIWIWWKINDKWGVVLKA